MLSLFQHDILQTRLLSNNSSYNRRFTAFDDVDEGENEKVQVQLLMKLFAVSFMLLELTAICQGFPLNDGYSPFLSARFWNGGGVMHGYVGKRDFTGLMGLDTPVDSILL